MKKFLERLEKTFIAITFAEAGCPELAKEFLVKEAEYQKAQTLYSFLETVGLKEIRVCYVVANI